MTVCYIEKMKKNNKEHYCHRFLIKHLILSLVLNVILSSMTSLLKLMILETVPSLLLIINIKGNILPSAMTDVLYYYWTMEVNK